jgi:FMN-dependent NADH-azoreductase
MMDKILLINACVRPCSRTLELTETLLQKLKGDVEEVRLYEMSLPALDLKAIEERHLASQKNDFSDSVFDVAKQFAAADIVVVAAPYWDFMFPAVVKTYLENITVAGITFRYSEEGRPRSLCRAKALHYVTTAGGFIGQNDFGFSYMEALARDFFGINEIRRYAAEGLDIFGADVETILSKAKAAINEASQERRISYPEKYGGSPSLGGASSFCGTTEHHRSRYYVANDFFHMKSDATLHILSQFQTYQQTTEYTCGASSALMVLNWFGQKQYHEKAVAALLESHCTKGSSVENIADLFDLIGWNVDYHADTDCRFQTIEAAEQAIIDYIDRGIPMMIDWVDWAGHWQVLIGIDTCGTDTPYDDVLIFADPYDVTDHKQDGYYTYPLGRFFGMWREGPCVQKSVPYQQPFVAAWPKGLQPG